MARGETLCAEAKSVEECLIYYSVHDNCWIAHGLYTDQIGTGECVINALVDYRRGVINLLDLQKKQKDIAVFRDAPAEVRRLARSANLLPKELYSLAYRKLNGDWPKDIKIVALPDNNHSLKAKKCELIPI